MVLDSRIHEIILLKDKDVLETQTGVDGAAVDGQTQVTSVLSGQQQAINLGRLKEFCLDVAEKVAPAAVGATSTANPSEGP